MRFSFSWSTRHQQVIFKQRFNFSSNFNNLNRSLNAHIKPFSLPSSQRSFSKTSSFNNIDLQILKERLCEVVGPPNISTAESTRLQHGKDESHHRAQIPDIVVFPSNTQEVSEVAKVCTDMKVTMVPFGTGTGMEGGCVCTHGGVSVDLSRMAEIREYQQADFSVCVEPGVTRLALNEYLRGDGLWFPVDPGADASLCGMAATSASGTNAVRYGTMRENVRNLEVVLSDGTIIHTAGQGRHTVKSSAGYNLTNLFVGSEGTLGFITSATLKLYGIPDTMTSAVCQFDEVERAVTAVLHVLQCGVAVARIEFHGSEKQTEEDASVVGDIFADAGASGFQWASSLSERNRLWKARHDTLYAILATRPGPQITQLSTDVCVPISQLTKAITDTEKDLEDHKLPGYILGHVGDGNYHVTFLYDTGSETETQLVGKLSERIVERALELNGTCTGEHGTGFGKKKYLVREAGPDSVSLMKQIKHLLDPHGLMNPGKVLP
ncbi:LDHD [Bugula neritina]|uniref:Probable D-lactate dehydrogenase, mitochondrial n=1 Tax=Bugula neritina TaxID=10212 RepID=A0A7J7K058_BUGNE|nr:LDHD [Bugula neritina]